MLCPISLLVTATKYFILDYSLLYTTFWILSKMFLSLSKLKLIVRLSNRIIKSKFTLKFLLIIKKITR